MPRPESESGKPEEKPQSLIQKMIQPHIKHMGVGTSDAVSRHVHPASDADFAELANNKMSAESNLGKSARPKNESKPSGSIDQMKEDAAILKQSDGHPKSIRINNLLNLEAMANTAIGVEEKLLEIPAVQELYKQGDAAVRKFQELQKKISDASKKDK